MILLPVALLFLLCREGWGRRLIPHVTAPETWRLGLLEEVVVRTSRQSESFPVTVSLVSFPDKKTTFSSALLALTPDNRFRGAVELSVTAEDSPGEFLYLVVESEAFREDTRIRVTGAARTTMDEPGKGRTTSNGRHTSNGRTTSNGRPTSNGRIAMDEPVNVHTTMDEPRNGRTTKDISAPRRRRRESLLTATQIQRLTQRFLKPNIQRCCLNGADYYAKHENCDSEQNEAVKKTKPHCYLAYVACCADTEGHMLKVHPIAASPGIDPFPDAEVITHTVRVPEISGGADDTILITVKHSSAGSAVTRTFTVKVDPNKDVSVQLSSAMFDTSIDVVLQTLPPASGDQ